MKRLFGALVTALSLLAMATSGNVLAAGTSTYSLQVSGNRIDVYETSAVAVNTVEADFSYTGLSSVAGINVAAGSTFTSCISPTSTSITCSALGGNITGTHLVASLTITLSSGVTSANVTAHMVDSSLILASSDNTDTLNHASLPSATYSYTAPAPQPQPQPQPSPSPTPSPTVSKASNASSNSQTSSIPENTAPATSSAPAPQVLGKSSANPVVVSTVAAKQAVRANWLAPAGIVLLTLGVASLAFAGVYWLKARYTFQFTLVSKSPKK